MRYLYVSILGYITVPKQRIDYLILRGGQLSQLCVDSIYFSTSSSTQALDNLQ